MDSMYSYHSRGDGAGSSKSACSFLRFSGLSLTRNGLKSQRESKYANPWESQLKLYPFEHSNCTKMVLEK